MSQSMPDGPDDPFATFDPREVQALHRRLLAAKDRGETPTPEDLDLKRRVMASPYAMRDRAWARDEY